MTGHRYDWKFISESTKYTKPCNWNGNTNELALCSSNLLFMFNKNMKAPFLTDTGLLSAFQNSVCHMRYSQPYTQPPLSMRYCTLGSRTCVGKPLFWHILCKISPKKDVVSTIYLLRAFTQILVAEEDTPQNVITKIWSLHDF